jgi:hypothetical protein
MSKMIALAGERFGRLGGLVRGLLEANALLILQVRE